MSLLLITMGIDYFCAIRIEDALTIKEKKKYLIFSLSINLCTLGFFKYFCFFVDSAKSLLLLFGASNVSISTIQILLPAGISFYTFQEISYVIDVYRGKTKACRYFSDLALFITYFPQLIAGPIERIENLLPQYQQKRVFHLDKMLHAIILIAWGFFEKLVIANHLGPVVSWVFDQGGFRLKSGDLLIGIFAFSIQIYADFLAYMDLARGFSSLLGIELTENFNRPYCAKTIQEFWHRWHITLSTWFRDYVYISLGGNRCSKPRQIYNIILTFVLSGLWHGANWTFVCWGLFHGVGYSIELFFLSFFKKNRFPTPFCFLFGRVYILCFVGMGWFLFRAPSMAEAQKLTQVFLHLDGFGETLPVLPFLFLFSALLAMGNRIRNLPIQFSKNIVFLEKVKQISFSVFSFAFLFFLIWIFLAKEDPPFIYFQF